MRLAILIAMLMLGPAAIAAGQARKPAASDAPAATPADGNWRGQSDAGTCQQPMEVSLAIDRGLVEGTGKETIGKAALLWSYHGRARADGTLELLGHASSFPPQNARQAKLAGKLDGPRLLLNETGGCGRKATLSRG